MILDSSLGFDLNAPLTASRPSTNVIDVSNARDIGVGTRPLWVLVQPTVALVGPAGTTLQVQWQGSIDNTTFNTMVETVAAPAVAVPAGRRFLSIEVPIQDGVTGTGSLFRYFRLNYVVGGGPLTAGLIFATLVLERPDNIAYPKNFTINA